MVLFTVIFLVICRICCLRKVKIDPMGMSLKDMANPSGSIVLTKELQEKIGERKKQRERDKKQRALEKRAGHDSLVDIDDDTYGYGDEVEYDDDTDRNERGSIWNPVHSTPRAHAFSRNRYN